MTIARDNLDALTGIRFVAAFTIVLGHAYQPWLEITGIGMPLFFTLSGFIIHYVYSSAFAAGWRRATTEFAIARFSRIYPLYAVLLVYYIVNRPMGPALLTPSGFPVLMAYVFGYWTWWPFTLNGNTLLEWYYHISWSVSTELFFYLCYALFFFRIARIRNFRACLVTLILFCLASYLLFYGLFLTRDAWEASVIGHYPQFLSRAVDFNASFYRWLLYVSPYARIFEFIGGCLTCQLFLLMRARPGGLDRVHAGRIAWIAIAAMVALYIPFRILGEHSPWLAIGNHSFGAFFVSLHMNFLFAPACYALIFALAAGGSSLSRAFSSRPCRFLGEISYSTYLSHPMAIGFLVHAGVSIPPPPLYVLTILAMVYPMSWAFHAVIEVPAKRALRQVLNGLVFRPPASS
jgi:peptidoglycan/LPS O-acetylase OafA/YrhL